VVKQQANGLRYLRWGGDGEAVQPACPGRHSPRKNDKA